jgi:hypothetical protein
VRLRVGEKREEGGRGGEDREEEGEEGGGEGVEEGESERKEDGGIECLKGSKWEEAGRCGRREGVMMQANGAQETGSRHLALGPSAHKDRRALSLQARLRRLARARSQTWHRVHTRRRVSFGGDVSCHDCPARPSPARLSIVIESDGGPMWASARRRVRLCACACARVGARVQARAASADGPAHRTAGIRRPAFEPSPSFTPSLHPLAQLGRAPVLRARPDAPPARGRTRSRVRPTLLRGHCARRTHRSSSGASSASGGSSTAAHPGSPRIAAATASPPPPPPPPSGGLSDRSTVRRPPSGAPSAAPDLAEAAATAVGGAGGGGAAAAARMRAVTPAAAMRLRGRARCRRAPGPAASASASAVAPAS